MNKQNLWQKALEINEKALKGRVLKPFDTKLQKIQHGGYEYQIRELIRKPRTQEVAFGPVINPFRPWESALEISKILDNHVLILNKYPVELCHLLLITKNWVPQNGWISLADWKALVNVERNINGFWFFNSSPNAGASQPHRHLQLLKRIDEVNLFPRQEWFENMSRNKYFDTSNIGNSSMVLRRNAGLENSANELENIYFTLCHEMNVGEPYKDNKPKISYNLIITKEWMCLIRRSKESYKGFNINALGFAGYLLITSKSNKKWLRDNNPLAILENVVEPIN